MNHCGFVDSAIIMIEIYPGLHFDGILISVNDHPAVHSNSFIKIAGFCYCAWSAEHFDSMLSIGQFYYIVGHFQKLRFGIVGSS